MPFGASDATTAFLADAQLAVERLEDEIMRQKNGPRSSRIDARAQAAVVRRGAACALIVSIGWMMAASTVTAAASTACQSANIHPGAFNVTLNNGDTSVVRVTGFKASGHAAAAPTSSVIHVRAGDALTVARSAGTGGATTVQLPAGYTGTVVIDAAPTASPNPAPSSAPPNTPATPPGAHPGGPADKLTATMKDERYASFSASPAPTASPSASGDVGPPAVDYTIKGQYPGDTALVVAQGSECVAIGVHVRPAISDRFLASAGIGMSNVPKYTITTVQAPASFSPPSTTTPVVTRVLKTEDSGHGFSIPLLFNYRLTDNAHSNLYGTVGFFTNPGSGGLVYGVSIDREQFLLTFGVHSNTVTDLAPGLHNNDIVPANINTSITRRVTTPFVALTISTKFVSQLLSPITGASAGGSSSGGSSGSSSTGTSSSGTAH